MSASSPIVVRRAISRKALARSPPPASRYIAPRAHRPAAPVGEPHVRIVSTGELGEVRLDLVPAGSAPDDQPQLGFAALPSIIGGAGLGFRRRDDYRSRSPLAEFFNRRLISRAGVLKKGWHPLMVFCRNTELVLNNWTDKSKQFRS
jgi:hypothetical protein